MLLRIRDLDVAYGDRQVLHKVSLDVREKTVVGIVGESGSGKSTLLNSILQLLGPAGHILNGQILQEENELLQCDYKKLQDIRGKEIAMIFQDPTQMLDPMERIGHLFTESIRVHDNSISRRRAEELAEQMLYKVGFEDVERIMRSYPYELSGGMNQRVAIGAALMNSPSLLLADEPTSALDVRSQIRITELLKSINEEGTTILLATHNMGLVAHLADYIGVMLNGQIIEYGTCNEVLKAPGHEYTKMLIHSVLTPGTPLPKPIPFNNAGCNYSKKVTLSEEHWIFQEPTPPETGGADHAG